MNLKTFIKECHDKEVFQKLSIYIVSSWILIQVLDITREPLGLPDKSVTFLIIALLIGFPINIYLVWRYHLAELEGLSSKEITENEYQTPYNYKKSSFKKIYFTSLSFITIFSFFVALIVLNNLYKFENLPESVESNSKIAVLKFGNNTGDTKYDIVGKMTSDWIIHGISENHIAQTVSPQVIENYTNILRASVASTKSSDVIKNYFKPSKIIVGNYFLRKGKLIFQSSIKDGRLNKTLISFKPIECTSENPLECIESLKQVVLGYLITEDKKSENLQEFPPKFEAYQYVIDAKSNLNNSALNLKLLNKAIAIDSNYFEPKVLRIANYYNNGNYKIADSLRKSIKISTRNNERQQNLLNLYKALLEGDNGKAYQATIYEYNITPFDLESNESAMAVALQFVNKPEDVKAYYDKISMDKMNLENCIYCEYRIYIKAMADVELQNYSSAINLLKNIPITKENVYLFQPLIAAYVRSDKLKYLKDLLNVLKQKVRKEDWQNSYFFTAKEVLLKGNDKLASAYFKKLIATYDTDNHNLNYAKSLYYVKDFDKAEKVLEVLISKSPNNIENITWLAKVNLINNKESRALKLIEKLKALPSDYQFGDIEYALAQYYVSNNDKNKVLEHLSNAVEQGSKYTFYTFQNDPQFRDYFETNEFKKILNYWH